MPRRYSQYDFVCADPQVCSASELAQKELWETLHSWSSIGSFILAAGLFLHLFVFIASLKSGKKAGPNPWGGVSLEWATASPPIEHNFHETPHVDQGLELRNRRLTIGRTLDWSIMSTRRTVLGLTATTAMRTTIIHIGNINDTAAQQESAPSSACGFS